MRNAMKKYPIEVWQFDATWSKDQGANEYKGTIHRCIRWREIDTSQSITLSRIIKRKVRVIYIGHKCYEVRDQDGRNVIMLAADDKLPRELAEARKEIG